jgi:hypothetical protein
MLNPRIQSPIRLVCLLFILSFSHVSMARDVIPADNNPNREFPISVNLPEYLYASGERKEHRWQAQFVEDSNQWLVQLGTMKCADLIDWEVSQNNVCDGKDPSQAVEIQLVLPVNGAINSDDANDAIVIVSSDLNHIIVNTKGTARLYPIHFDNWNVHAQVAKGYQQVVKDTPAGKVTELLPPLSEILASRGQTGLTTNTQVYIPHYVENLKSTDGLAIHGTVTNPLRISLGQDEVVIDSSQDKFVKVGRLVQRPIYQPMTTGPGLAGALMGALESAFRAFENRPGVVIGHYTAIEPVAMYGLIGMGTRGIKTLKRHSDNWLPVTGQYQKSQSNCSVLMTGLFN